MAVISTLVLSQFMNCPYIGAVAPGPLPIRITAPVNAFLPVISGSLMVGSVLTTTTGAWTGPEPYTFTYQWQSNGVDIPGAVYKTYVVDGTDVGFMITVKVTATNPGGSTTAVASPVGPVGGILNAALPIITGALIVGTTLVTDNGQWVGTPPPTFAYSWQRDGVDIPGATTNSYLLVSADTGKKITSRVIATNIAGSVSAYSAIMGPVTEHLVNTVVPVITGELTVGSVLSVTSGTWIGTVPITYAYQWKSDGIVVAGATTTSYVVTDTDLGKIINCVVTASNPLDTISVTTNSIGPIIPPATLSLSNMLASKSAAIGSTIGTLLVVGGTGTYTFELTSNPSGQFAISGSDLTVATGLNGGSYPVTVRATGGVPSTVMQNFTITIAALTLSTSTISEDADVGAVIGAFSVNSGTGSYTYALTADPSGQFAISGTDLVTAGALAAGSYPISVQATGGVPTPVSDNFMITVATIVVTRTEGAWFGGLPYPGIAITANKAGTSKYWYGGLIYPILKD